MAAFEENYNEKSDTYGIILSDGVSLILLIVENWDAASSKQLVVY